GFCSVLVLPLPKSQTNEVAFWLVLSKLTTSGTGPLCWLISNEQLICPVCVLSMVTEPLAELEVKSSNVTVSVTAYVSSAPYWCVGFCALLLSPSPKVHAQLVIGVSVTVVSVNWTVRSAPIFASKLAAAVACSRIGAAIGAIIRLIGGSGSLVGSSVGSVVESATGSATGSSVGS